MYSINGKYNENKDNKSNGQNDKKIENFLNIPFFQFVSAKNAGLTSTKGLTVTEGDTELQNVSSQKIDAKTVKSSIGDFSDVTISNDLIADEIDITGGEAKFFKSENLTSNKVISKEVLGNRFSTINPKSSFWINSYNVVLGLKKNTKEPGLEYNGNLIGTAPNASYMGSNVFYNQEEKKWNKVHKDLGGFCLRNGQKDDPDIVRLLAFSKKDQLARLIFSANEKGIGIKNYNPEFPLDLGKTGIMRAGQIKLYESSDSYGLFTPPGQLGLYGNGRNGIGFYTNKKMKLGEEALKILQNGNLEITNGNVLINSRGFRVIQTESDKENILFKINSSGNVSIGTNNPDYKLQVNDGDLFVGESSKWVSPKGKGLLMKYSKNENQDFGIIQSIDRGNGHTYQELRIQGSTVKLGAGLKRVVDSLVLKSDGAVDFNTNTINFNKQGGMNSVPTFNFDGPSHVVGLRAGSYWVFNPRKKSMTSNSYRDVSLMTVVNQKREAFTYMSFMEGGTKGTLKGRINNGGNFDNASFTGQHRCLFKSKINTINDFVGLIVECTGDYVNLDNSTEVRINESLPVVKLSEKQNNKNVFGVISNEEDNDNERGFGNGIFESVQIKVNENEQRMYVNSVGEGGIWVMNTNGNIEKGDYITSCKISPGYGRKQNDDLLHNYTVAKATCDCDFSLKTIPVKELKCKYINGKRHIDYSNGISFENTNNTSLKYKTRFFNREGQNIQYSEYKKLIENNKRAYIACFIGCTYHCG